MAEKDPAEDAEFFVPRLGLALEPYLAAGSTQGVHHLARYLWAVEVLKAQKPGRILDIACGSGYGSFLLAQALPGFTVLGGDYDPRAIALAQATYGSRAGSNLSWETADLVTWEDLTRAKPLGTFDYIVCFDTIEHLLHREIALINLVENLDSDGALLFSTPCGRRRNRLNPAWEHHKIEYSHRHLFNLLSRFFGEVLVPDNGSLPCMAIWDDVVNRGEVRYMLKGNPVLCRKPRKLGFAWPPPRSV